MTIDFIPINFYTPLYYHIILIVTLITFLHSQRMTFSDSRNLNYIKVGGFFLFWFVLLYMGLRPIHGVFVDMTTYARGFERYKAGEPILSDKDFLFHLFVKGSSTILNIHAYFFICAVLYVVPLYLICKKWFKQYWFYAFLMLVGSFSFWAYGTNGIRNGIATSLFLLAISREKKVFQILWLLVSVNFHASMYLPAIGFVITWFYNKPYGFFYFWLAAIPLSLAAPGLWENIFATLVEDERVEYLTTEAAKDRFRSIGFRWDFLLYSVTGVFAGWYYIFKKKITDKTYLQLFNVFLFANAIWILVIRASYSNRFAYLSWFMLALVIVYPWLKHYFEKKQHQKLGWIILAYFAFTYFMGILIKII